MKPVQLKRSMVWGSFWLSVFVVVVAVIRWEAVPEGIPTILTGLFGVSLAVYGGAQTILRKEQVKQNAGKQPEGD